MAKSGSKFSYNPKLGGSRRVRSADTSQHESWIEGILPGDTEASQPEGATSRRPLLVLGGTMVAAITILGLQLARLQLVEGSRNLGLADGNRISQTITRAPRGVIYDRNKQPLAENVASFDITVTPELVPKSKDKRQHIFNRIGEISGAKTADIEKLMNTKGVNPLEPRLVASNVPRDQALLFDQESNNLTGFSLDVNPVRQYLDSGLLGAVLGYTGRASNQDLKRHPSYLPTDYVGKAGIEQQYDSVLKGINGSQQTEVDADRRPVKVLDATAARPGSNLVLSIDQGLQTRFTQALEAQMDKVNATQAAGVAMNPKTGEILALVSLPGFNSNQFAHGISQDDYLKLINNAAQPLFNKAVSGTYPTGSIIKPIVGSAALREGTITPGTTVNDTGALEVPNPYNPDIKYTYHGWERGGLGIMNLSRAIAMSSDIYFYTVGGGFGNVKGLGVGKLSSWYQKFGLGRLTGIDLPNESTGRVPTPDWKQSVLHQPWYLGDTFNISVGQGDILASPLQMATALSTIVNNGTIIKPHLLKQVIDTNGQVTKQIDPQVVGKLDIAPSHFQVVRDAMREVVTSGTGCCYIQQFVPVPVAGKTGTAETDPEGHRRPNAWFEAFAPYPDPSIVIVALVQNAGEGSNVAAPAVRDTLAWYFSPH